MSGFEVLAAHFILNIIAVLFVFCSLVLVLVILVQKGKGGGLSGALGGGIASGLLGSKTGDFLTWVTIIVVGVFLTLAVVMAKWYRPTVTDYGTQQLATQQSPPVGAETSQPMQGGTPIEQTPPTTAGQANPRGQTPADSTGRGAPGATADANTGG